MKKVSPAKKKGRPTKYLPRFDREAADLCEYGANDAGLASFFHVSEATINNWKLVHPSFFESIKRAKAELDSKVERSLYERAVGYSHPDDVIFNNQGTPLIVKTTKHYAPDTAAAFIWLKNRRPKDWRDKIQVEHEGAVKADPELIAAAREVAAALVK